MSDTPERIWLGQNMNGWIAIEYRPNWVQLPEYIRADRIETLQSEVESFRTAAAVAGPALQKALREIEALIAERDALAQKRNDAERVAGALTLENEALQADNARRRAVLALVMEAAAKFSEDPVMADNWALLKAVSNMRVAAGKARAALTGDETK